MNRSIKKDELIVHSDQVAVSMPATNSANCCIQNREPLQSMGRADNPYDNAFVDSLVSVALKQN